MVRRACLILFLYLASNFWFPAATFAQKPATTLDELFAVKGPQVLQGVHVMRLSDGKTLFEKSPDLLLSPASVTKLITAAAVLTRFSPVYTLKTGIYYSGTRRGSQIKGDLIVVGDGDPFLVSERLWQLAADIRNMGITEFTGDIVIDNGLFSGESRDDLRKSAAYESSNAYDAPVSAFGINFNAFALAMAPNDVVGKPAIVGLDPYPLRGVIVDNQVKTAGANVHQDLKLRRTSGTSGEEKLIATGSIPTNIPIYKLYRSVGDHVQMAGEYVRAFLKKEGVLVRGQIREGAKPADAKLLMLLDSYEMRRLVSGLNVFSNNFIADVLLKRLGAAFPRSGAPNARGQGSYENGLAVLNDFLKKDVGIKSDYVLRNGSGLTTENRIAARQITALLAYMEKRMDVYPEFLASLPASGWDGTLKHRALKNGGSSLKGLFRAKTGTLSSPISVVSLAGYFRHPRHGMVGFSIIENGKPGQAQPSIGDLRGRQDEAMAAFLNDL